MQKKYSKVWYNNNLFSAPFILKYGNLLNIEWLCDIRLYDVVTYAKYILCYDLSIIKHPKLLRYIKYLLSLEPNYSNTYIQNGSYIVSFNIPKNCKNLVLLKSTTNKRVITSNEIHNITTLRNKKAPSTSR